MTPSPNLFLVGPPGCGKTMLGRHLAERLGCEFLDSDAVVQERAGATIAELFEREGEEYFRRLESEAIMELTEKRGIVLATGAGAVLSRQNRRCLGERGIVVYLRIGVHAQLARIGDDRARPLLKNSADLRTTLERLTREREDHYREIADVVIDVDDKSIREIGDELIDAPATLKVATGERGYLIHVGAGLLDAAELFGKYVRGGRIVIVTDETVAPLYLERARAALPGAESIVLPAGERHKTLATFETICTRLLETGAGRDTTLAALGGGVIGDLTGFAAACYQRGVDLVQIPTTLLAQVDSSVGGKTAVNHALGKNMIGAFYQPRVVVIDTDVLTTLPDRQLSAGIAEIIKYGLILDADFFEWIEENADALMARDRDALTHAICRSCEIKARVVSKDERESSGYRTLLNLGHTFGHAIETAAGYGHWLHGEAVGCGLLLAAAASREFGHLEDRTVERVAALLERVALPREVPSEIKPGRMLDLMARDKKNIGGEYRLVLLEKTGSAFVSDGVDRGALAKFLERRLAPDG